VNSAVRGHATRVLLAAAGYAATRATLAWRRQHDRHRINYRGRPVSLAGGPALTVAASVTAAAGAAYGGRRDLSTALALAGLAGGSIGRYDDVADGYGSDAYRAGGQGATSRSEPKGLRGHLNALRHGQVTTGVVKLVGLGIAGLLGAAVLPSRRVGAARVAEVALGAGLIAGSANLVNLLDLRPGRALKVALLAAAALGVSGDPAGRSALAGPVGAVVALVPDDLGERVMLGDAGANALGAMLGVAAAARPGLPGRALAFAVVTGLTVASERWSFTTVIESTPVLRAADRLGRA
jgi:hypothetical protein